MYVLESWRVGKYLRGAAGDHFRIGNGIHKLADLFIGVEKQESGDQSASEHDHHIPHNKFERLCGLVFLDEPDFYEFESAE